MIGGKYGAFEVSSTLQCPKTMKNSHILTLLLELSIVE
jgi:hypothetical protein